MEKRTSWQDKLATGQTNVFKGSIRGRIKTATPIYRDTASDLDYDDDQGGDEPELVKFAQDVFPIKGSGTQTFRLAAVPQDNSEHVYWHPNGLIGIYQEQVQWSRVDNIITFNDDDNRLLVGDLMTVEYAYLESDLIDSDEAVIGLNADAYVYANYGASNKLIQDTDAYVYVNITRALPPPVSSSSAYVYMNIQ